MYNIKLLITATKIIDPQGRLAVNGYFIILASQKSLPLAFISRDAILCVLDICWYIDQSKHLVQQT